MTNSCYSPPSSSHHQLSAHSEASNPSKPGISRRSTCSRTEGPLSPSMDGAFHRMTMAFSNSGGATLTVPSPTHPNHISHIEVQSVGRSLRRSLSRSPSKFRLSRTASQSSDVSVTSIHPPNSPSPASPSLRRMASQHFGGGINSPNSNAPTTQSLLSQSPLATPFRPSVKYPLRSAKSSSKAAAAGSSSAAAPKSALRHRTSPKSPVKRALIVASSTSGNSAPSSSTESDTSGQENLSTFRTRSPAPRRSFEKAKNRHSMHLDMSGASLQAAMTRFTENNSNTPGSTASPLKRNDATMNVDQTSFGSPKAKRRSYGPSSFGADFNVYDHGPTSPNFDIHDEDGREYEWTASGDKTVGEPLASPTPSAMPRRAGSLRKSTLQQRHTGTGERLSWGRRQGAHQLSQFSNDVSTPVAKNRPRLSLDHYMPPPQRDSPFNAQGPLPNPSAHMVNQQVHQPHPLSRTMTTSSSNSSIPDESPTHFPVPISQKPRAPMNWSKSLPLGAIRPTAENDARALASVSTPDYKAAKPFSGAFASTGLVSKMNRNPELEPIVRGGAAVPDTPCKKQVNGFATYPPNPTSSGKKRGGMHIKHTFGAPSTPFNPNPLAGRPQAANTFGDQSGRPVLFTGFGAKHGRKGSLLSLYSDDGRSPIDPSGDSQMTIDGDIPPTPTKQQLLTQTSSNLEHLANDSPTAKRQTPAPLSAIGPRSWQQHAPPNCEYSPPNGSWNEGKGEDVVSIHDTSESPTPLVSGTALPITISLPSFSRTRAKRGLFPTPAPLETRTVTLSEKPLTRVEFAKTIPVFSASPLEKRDFTEEGSPRTPQENDTAPDASRLSISNPHDGFLFPTSSGRKSILPPATPTTRPDGFSLFHDRRAITPTNGLTQQVDMSLLNRFGKVEYIGHGEFSQVYRVVDAPRPVATQTTFSTPKHRTPPSPSPDKVFAVKKLRLPFKGTSDRELRLREVAALEALRGCDHVLQLVSSWEEKNSLYIQTEYCEEGSLDVFLAAVGIKGRLDDFRIWKIMLELSQVSHSINLSRGAN